MKNKEYYFCSEPVILAFKDAERSKPFKSGYSYDSKCVYYVAVLDHLAVKKFYSRIIKQHNNDPKQDYWIDFFTRQCAPSLIDCDDVKKITLGSIRKNGLLAEIENKTGLTTETNIAYVIYALSQKYNCFPVTIRRGR